MARQSIRERVLDLLGTYRDEWMSVESLLAEYASRWGEPNPDSFRRAISRLMAKSGALIEWRHVPGPFSVNPNLELRMTSDAYWSWAIDDDGEEAVA